MGSPWWEGAECTYSSHHRTLGKMSARRKSSIMNNRKLSVDFARKLSAISCASDVSCISTRLGMEQGQLKNIVQDILEMDKKDEMSEYDDDWDDNDDSIGQDLNDETVHIDERKASTNSTSSEASIDSLNAAEAFRPVEINLGEVKTVLKMYNRHKISVTSIMSEAKRM